MNKTTFSFRVDEALMNEFTAAAKSRDRNGAELLRNFMRAYVDQQDPALDHDAWFEQQVKAGMDSAKAGRLVSNAEVEAMFAARRADTKRRLDSGADQAIHILTILHTAKVWPPARPRA